MDVDKQSITFRRVVGNQVGLIGPNPSGLCMCGCGRKTKIVTKSDRRHGHVMGSARSVIWNLAPSHNRTAGRGQLPFLLEYSQLCGIAVRVRRLF